MNRYIYHYNCQSKQNPGGWSGIAQLTFRIVEQEDLNKFRQILSDKWNEEVCAVLSLSYLGREQE